MQHGIDYKRFAVLFVDDEEITLRLFDKFFSDHLRVYTAPNVDRAAEVLEQHGDDIGVLITDQRMPGRQGVDLLKIVRNRHPDIIRILTTGFTSIHDTIEAVNGGEIFRYISKPWNPDALRNELMHAMELFVLRRERDLFVEEKMSVRQRQTQSDRLRDLTAMCGSLRGVRRPLHAVHALLVQLIDLAPTPPVAGWEELDHWGLIHKETRSMLALGHRVSAAFGGGDLDLGETINPAMPLWAALTETNASRVESRPPTPLPTIRGNRRLIERLFALLLDEAERLRGDAPIRLAAEGTPEGARFTLALPGAVLPPPAGTLLTSSPGAESGDHPLHGDLLAAYLIAHHHGGTIAMEGGDGITLRLDLPSDPEAVSDEALDERWMDEILVRFEGWG